MHRYVSPCQCHQCIKDGNLKIKGNDWPLSVGMMILCPTCGNKRCPQANNHRNPCTNSNESGQQGSGYENCKPAASGILLVQP